MATFTPDASKPIVWNWINNDLEICPHEIQAAIEYERDCEKTDLTFGFSSTAIGVLSTAALLGLAGVTLAMVPPIALAVAGALHGYNAGIQSRRRELEAEFIEDYPDILKAIGSKLDQGQSSSKVASAYEGIFRLYRRGDDDAIIKVLGTVQTSGPMPIAGESSDHSADAEKMAAVDTPIAHSVDDNKMEPIAQTTAALPSSTSVKPGDSIGLDLAAVLLAMPEFCHILLAGENGTGKTTFAMALLKPIINKFIQITGFELLLIDPKRSRWNGLFQTKSYQSAFSNQPHDLERSVNRLERIYFKLDKLSTDRQKTGKRTEVPTLVIIDEVNTWLDALKAFDRNFKEENASLPPAERSPAPRLYNRAVDSIAGISRMGREDRVWLWLIGQNSNLEALGLSGAQDRANFSIVAVGLGDNQITIELALSNSTMFTRGQALKNALKEHQGKPYQIAACTRKPANLLIMPSSYKDNAQDDFPAEILARLGAPIAIPPNAPPPIAPSLSSEERKAEIARMKANIERLQELNEASHDERIQAGIDYEMHDSFDPPRDRLERLWEAAPAETDPAIELINEEQNPSKREALTIAYQWAMARQDKGDSIDRQTFLERARKDRNCEYLRDNRDEIWHCLEALIN